MIRFMENQDPLQDSWRALTRMLSSLTTPTIDHTPSDRYMTRWYSRVALQGPQQEIVDGLKLCLRAALQQYHEVCIYTTTVYRRTGFDCEYLLNANCAFFQDSQSFEHAIINLITAHHTRLHQCAQSLNSQCMQNARI